MLFTLLLSSLSFFPYLNFFSYTTATAIPIADNDVILSSGFLNLSSLVVSPVSPDDPTILPRAIPSGMYYFAVWRFQSRTTFSVDFTVEDTAADSHPVYAEATVYDINDRATYVLRCNNNNGRGTKVNCGREGIRTVAL